MGRRKVSGISDKMLAKAQELAGNIAKFHLVSRRLQTLAKWSEEEVEADAATAAWHAIEKFDESKGIPIEKWIVQAVTWRLTDQLRQWTHHRRGRNQNPQLLPVEDGSEPMERREAERWHGTLLRDAERINIAEIGDALEQLVRVCKRAESLVRVSKNRARELEERMIRSAMQYVDGHRSEAARILGINRTLLYTKLKAFGIEDSVPHPTGGESTASSARDLERKMLEGALKYTEGSVPYAAKILDISPTTIWKRVKLHGLETMTERRRQR